MKDDNEKGQRKMIDERYIKKKSYKFSIGEIIWAMLLSPYGWQKHY
jgi:hypothetical protein